ncbi:Enoyl-CoA hydratase/isomerase, conserved site,Crotonase superfamily,ClpP/crotonase-like [Cinara cedri]|uniref:Delta(3,5)-Delta(2,4)-dienoyl-CoA isomerase, mitochondrial n=1 Tax=Cinara cedri TaxID=506608 RepID=A0A5E4MI16_9HEMI|nr:Enoyl-CoA hydratase/isomerase, conserved site,Crotonase superfamily,ClpP/crotonase-like [Cinara cedri]
MFLRISNFKTGVLLFKNMSKMKLSHYHTLKIENPKEFVYNVQINRPEKANAMNNTMWLEIRKCFDELNENPDCRVVVLSANGKFFTSGIDLYDMMNLGEEISKHDDIARKSKILRTFIKTYQDCLTALEKCDKPVLTSIHGGCIGGGVDLISAADIRYCTQDAWFQIKETEIGMAADVGTLQRMPKIIGNMSTFNELAFTARKFDSSEAKEIGFVSRIYNTKESMLEHVMNIASNIAIKSPVGVQMTKRSIIYSRDHTVQDGLNHIVNWNQILLQSEDFVKASMAVATKDKTPTFSKL